MQAFKTGKAAARQRGNTPTLPGIGRAIAYAAVAFPLGAMAIPLTTMVPGFYSETFGLPIALVGVIAGSLRFYDLLIDPVLGNVSDHLQSRFGRRRPLIMLGLPVTLLGAWLLFSPVTATVTPAYFALALLVLYSGSSLIIVPYYSWGAEMPATPYGRTRMLGMREALLMAGVCAAALTPLAASAMGYAANGREAMLGLAVTLSAILPMLIGVLLVRVPDPAGSLRAGTRPGFREGARDFIDALVRNRPYRRMLFALALVNFGTYVGQAVFYFFISRILLIEKAFGAALLVSALCAIVSAPLWIWLSRRFELHKLVAVAAGGAVILRAIGFGFMPPGNIVLFLCVDAIVATVGAATLVLGPSLQAASIDYGAVKSGRDRAGTYIAISTVIMQSMAALTFLFVFPLLGLAGFEPSASRTSPDALSALKAMAVLAPLPFGIVAALVLWRFPLDRRRIGILTARLASRRGGRQS